jgi:hypothetical protein
MRVMCLALMASLLPIVFLAAEGRPVEIRSDGDSQWRIEAMGNFDGWIDRRNLIVLRHPWEESETGQSVIASCEIAIPQDIVGRARLHFYMADDYDCTQRLLKEDWRGEIRLIGHRFKQVLINGEVVWEADVADAADPPQPTRFSVMLSPQLKAGDRATLGFRLLDKTGSGARLPEDNRSISAQEKEVVKDGDPWRFMTNVWVGDIVLTPEEVVTVEPGEPPSHAQVRAVHARRWPVRPTSADATFPVQLDIQGEAPSEISRIIHSGIPLPAGKVRDPKQVSISSVSGKVLGVQTKPMNQWPDGSIRWLELDALLPAGEDGSHVMMEVRSALSEAPQGAVNSPVSVHQGVEGVILSCGALEIAVGGSEGVLMTRMINGQARVENMAGLVEIEGRPYKPIIDSIRVLAEGPIRGEVEAVGMLRSGREELGRFEFRASVFAGQPYVRITWRVFNDRPDTPKIGRFDLLCACPMDAEFSTVWGSPDLVTKKGGLLRQLSGNGFEVLDAAGEAAAKGNEAGGWIGLNDGRRSVCVMIRHFHEQYPKALAYKDGNLRVGLFEASESSPFYEPHEGEAKRHEAWIGLWDGGCSAQAMADVARYFAKPPHLFNSDYFCATGGFGQAFPHDGQRFAELTAFRNEHGGTSDQQFFPDTLNGIRHWGDSRHGKEHWCNGYYDRQQGYASEYLMTGDDLYFQCLEATVLHIIDIDVCHHSAEHPEWLGGIHGLYSTDHSAGGAASAPWNPGQRNRGTFAYWRYTGDPDVREAALGVADSAIRSNRAIGATSVRDHGGVLCSLTAAYDETRELRYLQAATRLVTDALGRIDLRRGCYAEMHGNVDLRGNVPWLAAQLAEPFYDYYRQSGNINAAIAVVGLAESIMTENCIRGVPGDVYGYSSNPHFRKTSDYNVLIAPILMYAYELTEDPEFLLYGRAMYEQTIREGTVNTIENCYWNVPTLLYYLQKFGAPAAQEHQ